MITEAKFYSEGELQAKLDEVRKECAFYIDSLMCIRDFDAYSPWKDQSECARDALARGPKAGLDYVHRDVLKVLFFNIRQLVLACESGMNWMDQVSRAKLSSATRGILHTDMGMCSSAIMNANKVLEDAP